MSAEAAQKLPVEWFVVALVAVVALLIWTGVRERRKRREGFSQFGLENGFLYCEEPEASVAEELAQIRITSASSEKNASFRNLLRGSVAGLDTVIADRTTGSGKSTSTSTIAAFKFANPLPNFMLCGESFLWHVAEKLGYSDIDIEGAPDFSRRFFLHGENEAAVRSLFKLEVTQAFEQWNEKKAPSVYGSGQWLVICYLGRVIPPAELREFLQQCEVVAQGFRRAQSSSVFG